MKTSEKGLQLYFCMQKKIVNGEEKMRTEVQDKRKAGVLVCSGCYNKNTVGWMAYNEQKSISYPSGD